MFALRGTGTLRQAVPYRPGGTQRYSRAPPSPNVKEGGSATQTFKRERLGGQGDGRPRRNKPTDGTVCLVATGPNAIAVSPWSRECGEQASNTSAFPEQEKGQEDRSLAAEPCLLGPKQAKSGQGTGESTARGPGAPEEHGDLEDDRHGVSAGSAAETGLQGGASHEQDVPEVRAPQEVEQPEECQGASRERWWLNTLFPVPGEEHKGTLCSTGRTAMLPVVVGGHPCEALLDTGASRCFINPAVVRRVRLRTFTLAKPFVFTVANGQSVSVSRIVRRLMMLCGEGSFSGDFLVGPIPFDIILGLEWFLKYEVSWHFSSPKLRIHDGERRFEVPVKLVGGGPEGAPVRAPGTKRTDSEHAYDLLAKQVAGMAPEEVGQLLRQSAVRNKTRRRGGERVKIKDITREAARKLAGVQDTPDEQFHPVLASMVEYQLASPQTLSSTTPTYNPLAAPVDEESPWPSAELQYSGFDQWITGPKARQLPPPILTVLKEHRRLFPDSLPEGLPPRRPYDHRIMLVPGKLPTKAPIYKMTPEQLGHHKSELAKLAAKGWIGHTYSPICAPTIMVDKHDDGSGERKMRMVVNYKALNALTIVPDFPMPTIQMILELLGGAKFFSTLDLEAGFHQIRMAPEDRWKTAFRSVFGLYEYRVMPFGLKGAPATFQANINAYLQPLLGQGVIAYLDDVLIYSNDLDTHVSTLRQVLSIFLKHQFYPKLSKCKFAQRELDYLGYNIGAHGVKPAADKVAAIQLWPETLTNETQVRQFLGTVNYCRMFMGASFADMARPLVDLTRKGTPFIWTPDHTAAVRQLKQRLADYTVLQVPDSTQPYELYTDASGYAIGAVLEQNHRPVGFLSQAMNPTQQRYSIYDQELLALVTALDKWQHLLRCAKVTAYTDHQALTHLQSVRASKPLRGRTARWLDFLAEFQDLTITYLAGARNNVADAMSRLTPSTSCTSTTASDSDAPLPTVCSITAADLRSSRYNTRRLPRDFRVEAGLRPRRSGGAKLPETPPSPPTKETGAPIHHPPRAKSSPSDVPDPLGQDPRLPGAWVAAYPRCPVFRDAYQKACKKDGELVTCDFRHQRYTFRFVPPYLYIRINGLWRACVPTLPEFLSLVLYRFHDHATSGHRGQKKTYAALSKHFYWPGMHAYAIAYVESCTQCRASKAISQKPAGLLQPLEVPARRWSHVSLDFITDLPVTSGGNDSILVIVDSLSKMAHFIPTKKTATAADTVDLLADRLIRYHGFPEVLISDRDPRFQSDLWQQLCRRFNIKRAMSSPYHPQSDGQTERVNRTLEQMLRACLQADEREWERLLPALELAYNVTSHSSTELSPFEVMIGQNPVTPADIDFVGPLEPTTIPPMTKIFQHLCDRARAHLLSAKWRQKWYADRRRREVTFQPGDRVWISARNLPGYSPCSKLEPRFRGPFPITERVGAVAYRVALPPTYSCHDVFHVSQLVPDKPRDPTMNPQEAAEGWRPVLDAEGNLTDHYEVDYILDQRGAGKDAQYLVKWRGTPEDRATWEPACHLDCCPAVLRAWRRNLNRRRRTAAAATPRASRPLTLEVSPAAPPSGPGGESEAPTQ